MFSGCEEEPVLDKIPDSFFMIQLNPDDIYIYNHNGPEPVAVRLDPLVNDSIKVDVTISYSTPLHGSIAFVPNEGWFYSPEPGYFGLDNIVYTLCYEGECWSSNIMMYMEHMPDPATCTFAIVGEEVTTAMNAPIAIRIFDNDTVCSYHGLTINSPEKGTFDTFTYSGNFKNVVYVYYPPANFRGTDRFKYRIYTPDGFIETYCNITVN